MTGPPDDTELLARTAELGAYFAIARLAVGDGTDLGSLLLDEAAVRDFTIRTQTAIATSMNVDRTAVPLRMAASSFHLNVMGRLMSPVIGAAVLGGEIPVLTHESVRWRHTTGHAPEFGVGVLDWAPASTPAQAAEAISRSVLASIVGPFNDTLAATLSLSTHVSWGNAVSAINGAVTVLAMTRPDLEWSGREVVRALLDSGPLRNTGGFTNGRFVRRSCCLFYQAPGAGLCGDCVLSASV